jgi:hypothetical protein
MKTENAGSPQSHQDPPGTTAGGSDAAHTGRLPRTSGGQIVELSVRAENVLKELATELTGENPPRGRWTPSEPLLQQLTYRHLTTARNCGPQTTAEIVRWALARGKVIKPSFRVGRSLSAMWQDVMTRFSSGEASKAELAAALENSARRKNTRIPVEFQKMLLQLVNSSDK